MSINNASWYVDYNVNVHWIHLFDMHAVALSMVKQSVLTQQLLSKQW